MYSKFFSAVDNADGRLRELTYSQIICNVINVLISQFLSENISHRTREKMEFVLHGIILRLTLFTQQLPSLTIQKWFKTTIVISS